MKIVFKKSLVFVLLVSLHLTLKPAKDLIGCNRTPLSLSLRNNNLVKAQHLIDMGANVNAIDVVGRTPYYWALKENNQDNLDFLQKNRADMDIITKNGPNIFFYTVRAVLYR